MQLKQQSKPNQNGIQGGLDMRKIIQSLMNDQIQPSTDSSLLHLWTSLKITIGSLLIRGYRTFKYMLQQQCIIFVKRQAYHTRYLYFKIALHSSQQLAPNFIPTFNYCINQINKFRKTDKQNYSIFILFSLEYNTLEITNSPLLYQILMENKTYTKNELKNKLVQGTYIQDNFAPAYKMDEVIIGAAESEQKKLKQIVYSYIDTFGQKLKTNYYKELTKKSLYIINTVNYIIFEETKPCKKSGCCTPLYNQIQSSNWTYFKGRMESDRKDIVLSGNGRILFIDLIFLESLNQYANTKYEEQVDQLIIQCKKAYQQAKVKIIRLQKSLVRNIYTYQQKMVDDFSKVPVVS